MQDDLNLSASDSDPQGTASQSSPFDEMTDEEIVALCHEGNDRAINYLLIKYKNFVRSKARSYFLVGADH
jgi:RNA polymerase sporulation-specific sigma factor